jgi:hypothetical protein
MEQLAAALLVICNVITVYPAALLNADQALSELTTDALQFTMW